MTPETTALLIIDPAGDGWFNMAADDYLAKEVTPNRGQVIIRFYEWLRPTVSLGCFQSDTVVDRQACMERGWDVVRRPTGGRALLHWGDVSYSVFIPATGDRLVTLKQIYNTVASAWVQALRNLGIQADEGKPANHRVGGTVNTGTRLCLDTHTRGEVTVGRRKIAAAAQKLYDKAVLQHGSIPLTGDTGAIASVTSGLSEERRRSVADSLRENSITLTAVAGRTITADQLITAVVDPLSQLLSVRSETYSWSESDFRSISARREKFEICTSGQ